MEMVASGWEGLRGCSSCAPATVPGAGVFVSFPISLLMCCQLFCWAAVQKPE